MKMKSTLAAAAALMLSPLAGAFTLDFASITPSSIGTLTLNVPGYGDVTLSAATGSSLVFGNDLGQRSLQFENNESLIVTFLPGTSLGAVTFNQIALDTATDENFSVATSGNQATITLNNSLDSGAGLTTMSFTAVPEPSAAILGLIGSAGLLIRRKR